MKAMNATATAAPVPAAGERARTRAALLAVVGLGLLVRLAGLTEQSLWYDEGGSLVHSGGATVGEWYAQLQGSHASERYQPLYFAALRGWRGLFGDSEAALRGLSVAGGVAAVAVVGAAGLGVGGALHGLLAAALLALSAFAVTYSQEVRPYALLMLLAAVQLACLLRALTAPARAGAARRLCWLATALAAAAGPFAILASAALALAHLWVDRRWRSWLGWWLPPALLALPIAVWLVQGLFEPAPPRAEHVNALQQPLWQNALFVAYGLLAGTSFGPPLDALRASGAGAALRAWAPALAALGLAAGATVALTAHAAWRVAAGDERRPAVRLLAATLLAGAALQLAFAAASGFNWQPRHACALLLPAVLLAPLAVTAAAGRLRALGGAALLGLAACNGLSLAHYTADPAYQRDDYRAAAAYLRGRAAGDPAVVVLWGRAELLAYYGAPGAIDGTAFGKGCLGDRVDAAVGAHRALTVVVNRPYYWDDDPRTALAAALGERFALVGQGATRAFVYFHLERRR
jgi:hypothetical protein